MLEKPMNVLNNKRIEDRLKVIREKGVLTIGSSNDIPFAFINLESNEFSGIDAEIITEVAKRLGIKKVQMKQEIPFENLIIGLNSSNDIDIIADGMYVTEERKKDVLFTNIWYKESEAIIVPKVSKIAFKEDLINSVIGAQRGTAFLDLAEKWKKDGLIKDVIVYGNQRELLKAVNNGNIDAAVTDSIVATYLISKDNSLYLKKLSPYTPEASGVIAAAVRKSDVNFVKAINEQIDEMKNDKTILNILKKYGLDEGYLVSVEEGHVKSVNN